MSCFLKTDGTNPDFIALCGKLDESPAQAVGADVQHDRYAPLNMLDEIHDVIVLYDEQGAAIGAGAYKRINRQTIELKRIYIDLPYRRQGYGKAPLGLLEQDAARQGYRYALLETGKALQAAVRLYRASGYEPIANYGAYRDLPNSVCMKKQLR